MRILLVSDYLPPRMGGVGQVVAELAREYTRLGHQVQTCSLGAQENLLRINWRLFRWVRQQQFDLVHLHQTQLSLWLPFSRQKCIYTFHTSAWAERRASLPYKAQGLTVALSRQEVVQRYLTLPLRGLWERALTLLCPHVTFTAITKAVATENGLFAAPIVPNGVRPAQTIMELAEPIRLAYAGTLRSRKRAHQLPEVLAGLKNTNWRMTIMGGGFNCDHAPTSDPRVSYLGAISQQAVLAQLAKHHIYCLFSIYEGMPLATLEAMAHGLVPCVSDIPAHQAFIQHGVNGWLVPPDDTVAQAAALDYLLVRPTLLEKLSQQARLTATSLDWPTIAQQYCSLVTKIT